MLFCETYNCEGAEQLQNGYVAYGRYSYIGKKMPGKIFSRHLFHLCGANIRLRWQIPDSILAAQKKYCSKENLARMVKYRVKTIKKDEKNL